MKVEIKKLVSILRASVLGEIAAAQKGTKPLTGYAAHGLMSSLIFAAGKCDAKIKAPCGRPLLFAKGCLVCLFARLARNACFTRQAIGTKTAL